MKRAKIMLFAIAVLASVGGLFAFKAKKFGETKYCYVLSPIAPPQGAGNCTSFATSAEMFTVQEPITTYWYTTTNSPEPEDCEAVTTCPNFAHDIRN